MLKSIRVKSLFERYDYYFDFSKSKMTVIAGPNGYGKTTILNIIRDVLDDNLSHLSKVLFREIELENDKGEKLFFSKDNSTLMLNGKRLYVPETINYEANNTITFTLSINDVNELRTKHHKYLPSQQVLMVKDIKSDTDDVMTEDVLLRINAQLFGQEAIKLAQSIMAFYREVGNTIYCSADRLFHDYSINDGSKNRTDYYGEVINTLPNKIFNLFNLYNSEYTRLSNDLDFSFVSQLNEELSSGSTESNEYSEEDFNRDMETINERLEKLVGYGFLYKEKYSNRELTFNDNYRVAFKIFAHNYLQKLETLEDLTNKLDLFQSIINSKLNNKVVVVENARIIKDIIKVKDGNNSIPLSNLSSGEKEIIVMYYNLIFESNRDLIALIDEPELSTHVSWQYDALNDFEKIMKINSSLKQIIVCTHSPQIINNRWEEVIDLFDLSKGMENG